MTIHVPHPRHSSIITDAYYGANVLHTADESRKEFYSYNWVILRILLKLPDPPTHSSLVGHQSQCTIILTYGSSHTHTFLLDNMHTSQAQGFH
jgi:hypothetical protein